MPASEQRPTQKHSSHLICEFICNTPADTNAANCRLHVHKRQTLNRTSVSAFRRMPSMQVGVKLRTHGRRPHHHRLISTAVCDVRCTLSQQPLGGGVTPRQMRPCQTGVRWVTLRAGPERRSRWRRTWRADSQWGRSRSQAEGDSPAVSDTWSDWCQIHVRWVSE